MIRRILGGLAIAAWSTVAAAGCGSWVAQCIYIDSDHKVQFNGLCAATVCANSSDGFVFMRFPNGKAVRIDSFRDGHGLPRPEVNGVPSTNLVPLANDTPWIYQTDEGEIFIMIDCPADCRLIDPEVWLQLQDYL